MTTMTTDWERVRAGLQAEIAGRLPEHVGRLSWSTGQIGSAQREGLHRLLTHAARHSPFHRRRLAGVAGTRVTPDDLAELPVMTRPA